MTKYVEWLQLTIMGERGGVVVVTRTGQIALVSSNNKPHLVHCILVKLMKDTYQAVC